MTQELARDPRFNPLVEKPAEFKYSVNSALTRLRRKGFLTGSKKRLPSLQRATKKKIERYLPIIDEVLRFRTKLFGGLVKKWSITMSREEAHSFGANGLIRAIETYDKKKGQEFKRYAFMKVASVIADEVRRRLRQKYRPKEVGLREDLAPPAGVTAETAPTQDANPALARIFQWRKKGIIDHRSAVILALHHVYGHSQQAIGVHFGLHNSRVNQLKQEASRKIRGAIKEE